MNIVPTAPKTTPQAAGLNHGTRSCITHLLDCPNIHSSAKCLREPIDAGLLSGETKNSLELAHLVRRSGLLLALFLLTSAATVHAESKWVLWKHSYEVWIDINKVSHRRDVAWKKVSTMTAKTDCDDRRVHEARAEYDSLTGKLVGATLTSSEVGFDQSNTRYKRGYRRFECWPDTVDPRRK